MTLSSDLQKYLDQIKSTLTSLVVTTTPEVETILLSYIANLEENFQALMNYVTLQGTEPGALKFVTDRLKEQEAILQSEFLSLVQFTELKAQLATSALKGILITAIGEILPTAPEEPWQLTG